MNETAPPVPDVATAAGPPNDLPEHERQAGSLSLEFGTSEAFSLRRYPPFSE
jgi:hypothetical protein